MDENLLQLLTELRVLKNAGELDDDESVANQQTLWRNRLEYNVLESCLRHHDEDVCIGEWKCKKIYCFRHPKFSVKFTDKTRNARSLG